MFNSKDYPPIERSKDGSLPRMTPRRHQHAVRIIEAYCCNYDNGNCLLLDQGEEVVCPQTISCSVCCMYFYHILLQEPEAQALNAALFHIDDLKRCVRCGKPFDVNRQSSQILRRLQGHRPAEAEGGICQTPEGR